jgi:hypothetical protein
MWSITHSKSSHSLVPYDLWEEVMPVFIRNLSLEYLVKDGVLDSDQMLEMYKAARWRSAHGAFYMVHTLPSGVEFIFRAVRDGEDIRILGTDTHLSGRCLWTAMPFFNATAKDADALSAVVACTNQAQDGVFVAHLVNAAVLPPLEEGQSITMQMVAFPFVLESYTSREAYEESYTANPDEARFPTLLTDKRVFPLNFMMKHDPDIPEEQRNQSLADDIVLICGPVLAVREAPFSNPDAQEKSFSVATIATQFGHLDVAFASDMVLGPPCVTGSYVVFSGMLSANVAVNGLENWIE